MQSDYQPRVSQIVELLSNRPADIKNTGAEPVLMGWGIRRGLPSDLVAFCQRIRPHGLMIFINKLFANIDKSTH